MSREATDWAFEQAPRCERPADHHVLLAMANMVRKGTDTAFPSVAGISAATGLDRKMILASLARLDGELIEDTGLRMGRTQQVKVWRLAIHGLKGPATGPLKGPRSGTL